MTHLSTDKGKSDKLGHIWACFLGLRGAPIAINECYFYLDTSKEGGHDIDIRWEILGHRITYFY